MFIVVLLNNDLYFQWDPQCEYRFSIMEAQSGFSLFESRSHTVDGVDDWSYFDYVFAVVNGVYDLKYYCMVIWDDQGGIVMYFKNRSYPHIDPMKQDQTYKP